MKTNLIISANESFAIVVPAYREAGRIGRVVEQIRGHTSLVIVVDDGSPDDTAGEARRFGAHVVRHEINQGKGAALRTGFACAAERGCDFVITMDGDGQHDPADLAVFLDMRRKEGFHAIVGNRMGHPRGMPLVRRATNLYMSWLLSREMKQWVPDTQSGFRLYGRDTWPHLQTQYTGFAAESAVLLNLAARGFRIGAVPIRVIYGDEQSKIRPMRDTARFVRMLRDYRRGVGGMPG